MLYVITKNERTIYLRCALMSIVTYPFGILIIIVTYYIILLRTPGDSFNVSIRV